MDENEQRRAARRTGAYRAERQRGEGAAELLQARVAITVSPAGLSAFSTVTFACGFRSMLDGPRRPMAVLTAAASSCRLSQDDGAVDLASGLAEKLVLGGDCRTAIAPLSLNPHNDRGARFLLTEVSNECPCVSL